MLSCIRESGDWAVCHGRESVRERERERERGRERTGPEQGDDEKVKWEREKETLSRAQTVNLTWISVREKEWSWAPVERRKEVEKERDRGNYFRFRALAGSVTLSPSSTAARRDRFFSSPPISSQHVIAPCSRVIFDLDCQDIWGRTAIESDRWKYKSNFYQCHNFSVIMIDMTVASIFKILMKIFIKFRIVRIYIYRTLDIQNYHW